LKSRIHNELLGDEPSDDKKRKRSPSNSDDANAASVSYQLELYLIDIMVLTNEKQYKLQAAHLREKLAYVEKIVELQEKINKTIEARLEERTDQLSKFSEALGNTLNVLQDIQTTLKESSEMRDAEENETIKLLTDLQKLVKGQQGNGGSQNHSIQPFCFSNSRHP